MQTMAHPYRKRQIQIDPITIGLWISLLIGAFFWFIPFVFIVFTALKTPAELVRGQPWFLPKELFLGNFATAWETGKFATYGLNSLLVTFTKVPIGMFVSALAAFAFSRLRFRYQKILFMIVIMGTMIPVQVALGPIFHILLDWKLVSTYLGILLPYIAFGIPYHVFLFNNFFRSIPREIDEAALMDGCSKFGLFWRVILPLSLPILAAVFILDFVSTWNEFAIALVVLQSNEAYTIPLGLLSFKGQFWTNYGALNAAVVLSIIPVVVVYLLFQRYFVSGLTAGAVKG